MRSTITRKGRATRGVALALAMAMMLVACGSLDEEAGDDDAAEPADDAGDDDDAVEGAEEEDAEDDDSAEASGDVTMVTVPKLTGVSWFDRMETGVTAFADDQGVDAYQQGSGQADAAAQVAVLEDLIASGVDALNVVPFQPDAVEAALEEAMSEGIVVITHEAPGITNADWDIEAFRNEDYGRNLMDELAARMGEEGEYAVMVGSLSSETHMSWVESAIEHQLETYPDMEQVGDIVETQDDSQNAYERMQELLAAYPDLQGIQGSASTDVVGVGQAVEEAGLEDVISVVGTSVPNDARAGIESGAIDLIAFWDPADAGYAMNALAQLVLDGETIEDGLDLGVPGYGSITVDGKVVYGDDAWVTVTSDNVDDYDF